MTRFARYRGSKSGSHKSPEEASCWSDLQHGIKQQNLEEQRPNQREESISCIDQEQEIVWADFERLDQGQSNPFFYEEQNIVLISQQEVHSNVETRKAKRKKDDRKVSCYRPDGELVSTVKFEGSQIRKEDAEKIATKKRELLKMGMPLHEIRKVVRKLRKKAQKELELSRSKVCYNCRKPGHMVAMCPEAGGGAGNTCLNCGSMEHSTMKCKQKKGGLFKYAICFHCKEPGHIAKNCPDNTNNEGGVFPFGGACRECGETSHIVRDCPQRQKKKAKSRLVIPTLATAMARGQKECQGTHFSVDGLDESLTVGDLLQEEEPSDQLLRADRNNKRRPHCPTIVRML